MHSHLVDIFAMVPQIAPSTSTSIFPARDARILRYQDVLAKLSESNEYGTSDHPPPGERSFSDGWMSEDEAAERAHFNKTVKSGDGGPLLGGFADADSAMS